MVAARAQERRLVVAEADAVSGTVADGIFISQRLEVILCRQINVRTPCAGFHHGQGNFSRLHHLVEQPAIPVGGLAQEDRSLVFRRISVDPVKAHQDNRSVPHPASKIRQTVGLSALGRRPGRGQKTRGHIVKVRCFDDPGLDIAGVHRRLNHALAPVQAFMQHLHAIICPFAGKADCVNLGRVLDQPHGINIVHDHGFLCLEALAVYRGHRGLDADNSSLADVFVDIVVPVLPINRGIFKIPVNLAEALDLHHVFVFQSRHHKTGHSFRPENNDERPFHRVI